MNIDAIKLLKSLVAIPSVSRDESGTANLLVQVLTDAGIKCRRHYNNVWALQPHYDATKPTLMLNSHHDTVKPSPAYTRNPYEAAVEDGVLYGLGSNDAGASVVSLASVFAKLYDTELPFNIILALTAEEEVMGEHGMRAMLPHLAEQGISVDMALVGEPTGMQPAVGERGLVVLDCMAHGRTGHAARKEGVNALYKAIEDIDKLRRFKFERKSELLGDISLQVTQINAGTQHNVVPDRCSFVVDVRTTDAYTNEQTVEILQKVIEADAVPRSTRVRASAISDNHPMVCAAVAIGGTPFVSPTTSDMALMPFPSLKMGPGQSQRSHTADEYVLLSEVEEAQSLYEKFIFELSNII